MRLFFLHFLACLYEEGWLAPLKDQVSQKTVTVSHNIKMPAGWILLLIPGKLPGLLLSGTVLVS